MLPGDTARKQQPKTAKKDHTEEFTEAKLNWGKLDDEEKETKKPNVEKDAQKSLLKPELEELKKADGSMSDEGFVHFLFKTFPPNHKENYKVFNTNRCLTLIVIDQRNSKKKVYIRLCTFYHPDKVDSSIHGEKYKVLVEEISKRVNARCAKM